MVMKLVSWFIAIGIFVTAINLKVLAGFLVAGALIVRYAYVFLVMN